jgi:hypothetical protein
VDREDNQRAYDQQERPQKELGIESEYGAFLKPPLRRSAVLEIGKDIEQGHLPQDPMGKQTKMIELGDYFLI